ncbi:hypothetical protein M5K25_024534 [Dendrobium thyrsiflorum]|uniref:Uncharacterized protein n=1 Tax=Dendrobium thyrsiflorum TaxID=117978 RepID=A0ABD0U2E3_DENTH
MILFYIDVIQRICITDRSIKHEETKDRLNPTNLNTNLNSHSMSPYENLKRHSPWLSKVENWHRGVVGIETRLCNTDSSDDLTLLNRYWAPPCPYWEFQRH